MQNPWIAPIVIPPRVAKFDLVFPSFLPAVVSQTPHFASGLWGQISTNDEVEGARETSRPGGAVCLSS